VLRLAWRGLVAHRVRLVATAVAVVLGVSFIAGTYVLTDTLRAAISGVIEQSQANVAVLVEARPAVSTSSSGGGIGLGNRGLTIPEATVARVAAVPGVAAADGMAVGAVKVQGPGGRPLSNATSLQLVFSVGTVAPLRPLTLRHGRFPTQAGQAVLDLTTARRFHITIGQTVRVAAAGAARRYRIVGLVGYGTADSLAGATIVGLTLPQAQAVLGEPGRLYDVVASAAPGVTPAVLAHRVATTLGPAYKVQTQTQAIATTMATIDKGFAVFTDVLLVFAGVALFVAVFLIFNTFSILLTQRARELALLRCIGATRRQLVTTVLAESAAIGATASVLGVGVGILLALGIRRLLETAGIDFPTTHPVVALRTVVVSVAVGTVATMGASLLPAWRGARAAPIAAMRDEPAIDTGRPAPLRLVTGVLLVIVGVLVVVVALHAGGGRSGSAGGRAETAGLGLVLSFLGLATLVPLVVRFLAGAIGWPLALAGRVPGKLGRSNAMRHPRRTASTAAALMIGLTLVSAIAVLAQSVQASTDASLGQGLHADFAFSPAGTPALSPTVAARLATLPQLRNVVALSSGQVKIELAGNGSVSTRSAGATGTDVGTYARDVSIPVVAGSLAAVHGAALAVTTGIASAWDLHVGSELPLGSTQVARLAFTVAAVFRDPTGITGDLLLTTAGLAALFPQRGPLVGEMFAQAAPGVPVAVAGRAISRALRPFPQVRVETKAEFISRQDQQFQELVGVVTALLGLAVLIALFGIVNTLALSVIERRREIGLLRALGLSRRQLRAAVRFEAVIVALLGTLLGIFLGLVFGWVVVDAVRSDGVEVFSVPVVELGIFVGAAVLAGVLAAVVPARSAARVDVLAAITTE